MLRGLRVAVWAALFVGVLAPAAVAKCLPHDRAVENLRRHYDEQPVGAGLDTNVASVFELFVSASGSWTILITGTTGMSCVIASGAAWGTVEPKPLGEKGT